MVEERHEDHVEVLVEIPDLVHVLVLHALPREELAQELLRRGPQLGLLCLIPFGKLLGVLVREEHLRPQERGREKEEERG